MFRVPMIFPGQASQSVGMAADLVARGGPASDFLKLVDDIVGEKLTDIMFNGPREILTETRNAQPAILAHSVAVALELGAMGISPDIVAGHSLGEFSAAVAAGALTPEDGLRAVRLRGELMFAAGRRKPGAMSAVLGLSADRVEKICADVSTSSGIVCLANHNSAEQVAISGESAAVAAAGEALREAGAKRVIPLPVSGAFHSPLLADAAARFAEFLADLDLAEPTLPLVANVSARAVTAASELRDGFARQMTSPVRWHETMELLTGKLAGEPVPQVVLEVGPGRVLTNLARRAYSQVKFVPIGSADDLDKVLDILQGELT